MTQAVTIPVEAKRYSYAAGSLDLRYVREIAVETPVEISFGGAAGAVMMATPADLVDFGTGFAFTEGVIERRSDVRNVELDSDGDGAAIRINLTLTAERMKRHLARKRAIAGRTGCGLCGVESLSELVRSPGVLPPCKPIAPGAVENALKALEAAQRLNQATRAVHAAAWCDAQGNIMLIREDVGRHNALDKCIGRLLQDSADPTQGFFLITSRCSYEMVAKAARFGAGTLVSLSAPTSLALQHAREYGLTLIATARADHAVSFDL